MREASLGLGFSVPMTARRKASPGLYGARNTSHPNKSVSSPDGAASSYSLKIFPPGIEGWKGETPVAETITTSGFEWRYKEQLPLSPMGALTHK
jgi:hypothetical protein